MAFSSHILHNIPGQAPQINVLFREPVEFPLPVSYSLLDTLWNACNRRLGNFMIEIWRSYKTLWSLPLANVKWHSKAWPVAVTSQPIRLDTNLWPWIKCLCHRIESDLFLFLWIPNVACTESREVSIEHGDECGMKAGNAYPSGHLVPFLFGDLNMLYVVRQAFPNLK